MAGRPVKLTAGAITGVHCAGPEDIRARMARTGELGADHGWVYAGPGTPYSR